MVKARGLGLDVFMIETVDYHKARRLAFHVAATGIVSASVGLAAVQGYGLSAWAVLGAIGPLLVSLLMSERTRRAAPSGSWSPAHRVTLLRAVLVGGVAASAWSQPDTVNRQLIIAAAAVAFALDGVDGWLARRTNTASPYGARLDMELDAAFVLVLGALVWVWGLADGWVMLCGAARYLWWLAEQAIPWFQRPLFSSNHRRYGCFIAVSALILALWPWPTLAWSMALAGIATITLALSFGVDGVWLFLHRGEPR